MKNTKFIIISTIILLTIITVGVISKFAPPDINVFKIENKPFVKVEKDQIWCPNEKSETTDPFKDEKKHVCDIYTTVVVIHTKNNHVLFIDAWTYIHTNKNQHPRFYISTTFDKFTQRYKYIGKATRL